MQEVLAHVYRGQTIESVHYGSIVVVNNTGSVIYYAGDPELVTFTRSSLKPFQAVPLVESGGLDKYGFDLKALAIMCGSHAGSPLHTAQVQSNLQKIGLDESFLKCGTHPPLDYIAKNILPRREEVFTPIQHNCSGKHSGLLALALLLDRDPGMYLDENDEVQKIIRQVVSEICEIESSQMQVGIDGCSLPNYAFPIRNLALGFANLGTLKTESETRKKAFQKIIEAMQTHPVLVSGEMRSDYDLMQALPKELICKVGGEGVQGMAILSKKWGLAVKIADGSPRPLGAVVVEVLRQLGVLPDNHLEYVKRHQRPEIFNAANLLTGHVEPAFKLKRG